MSSLSNGAMIDLLNSVDDGLVKKRHGFKINILFDVLPTSFNEVEIRRVRV